MKENFLNLVVGSAEIHPVLPRLGGANPRGDLLAVTNAYLTYDGKPWIPIAGEFHYSRYPASCWRAELAKLKAYGIDTISTYVFWNHHEEEKGRFNWSDNRDLRGFVGLCGELGLFVILRVGPFGHGEVRNGGFPDWLYGAPFPVRSNDARYLGSAAVLYREIGKQTAGLEFGNGGPIIGFQLENEYEHAGAPWETTPRQCYEYVPLGSDGAAHMLALKRLAVQAGLVAPLYTCTAWGGSPLAEGEFLPLYGGYAFCPWNITETTPDHSPTKEYVFRDFRSTAGKYELYDPAYEPADLPFACCEMGGGMQSWYTYRPVVPPASVEAMALVKLAGGCSFLGYYMFHGGSNPVGNGVFLNEHVVPRISYDFQAPIGEYGQVRESCRRLARLHLFVRSFGELLAPMAVSVPDGSAAVDPNDRETLRYCARSAGSSGFFFLNNFQDHAETNDQDEIAVSLRFPGGPIRIPASGGFTLRSGECAIMPFGLEIGGVRFRYATAQPLATLSVDGELHVFFFEHEGIRCEYCFEVEGTAIIGDLSVRVFEEGNYFYVRPAVGSSGPFEVRLAAGAGVTVHTLTAAESLNYAILPLWDRERAVITAAELVPLGDELHLRYRSGSPDSVDFSVFPAPAAGLLFDGKRREPGSSKRFARYRIPAVRDEVTPIVTPINRGPDVEIELPSGSFNGRTELFLRIDYLGDVAGAYFDGRLVADNFANGEPWEIGLRRFRPEIETKPLTIHVTPMRHGSFVARQSGMAQVRDFTGTEIARILSARIEAEREIVVRQA